MQPEARENADPERDYKGAYAGKGHEPQLIHANGMKHNILEARVYAGCRCRHHFIRPTP